MQAGGRGTQRGTGGTGDGQEAAEGWPSRAGWEGEGEGEGEGIDIRGPSGQEGATGAHWPLDCYVI